MSSPHPHPQDDPQDPHSGDTEEAQMLDAEEAEEEIIAEDGDDIAMDSGDEDADPENEIMQEIYLQNDSTAHFDLFHDSIFCIAQHPIHGNLVAVGGSSSAEDEDAPGIGYIFDSLSAEGVPAPVLPASYRADGMSEPVERKGLDSIFTLSGHTDSINCLEFTLPRGEYLVSGGLDGKLRAYAAKPGDNSVWKFMAEATEVPEINWIHACPAAQYPNTIAFGASDGSVWVYTLDMKDKNSHLTLLQSYFLHTESCTAGAWTPDGKMLATVCEGGALHVWDVFGEAAVAGVMQGEGGQTVFSLTALDQRFAVEGGLFSCAVAPTGAFVVVGGAGGAIKVVGLPRLGSSATTKGKANARAGATQAAAGQAGQILADLNAQSDGIESLSFASTASGASLLAAGSVDGSIALYDWAHRFAVRRHIKEAHEEQSVVKVEFLGDTSVLTSCGMDGVVRRWECRGGTAAAGGGMLQEWKGHRGDGEGGGVLGFVQGGDIGRIVTAGDDGVSLVFEGRLERFYK